MPVKTTLGGLLGIAIIVACTIDRPSETLECNASSDCDGFPDNRACEGGYCVVSQCPAACDECSEDARTCLVECSTAADCGEVSCPAGWNCTINCTGDGACNDVLCPSGSSCTVTCAGDNACGAVRCSSACQCDVACVGAACASMSCPTRGNGANEVQCTLDGTPNTECDSARDSRCAGC